MKRLFEVEIRERATNKKLDIQLPNKERFFETKPLAKKSRNHYNSEMGKGRITQAVLILGPDHRRYGVKGNPRTHSHDARSGGSGTGFKKNNKKG